MWPKVCSCHRASGLKAPHWLLLIPVTFQHEPLFHCDLCRVSKLSLLFKLQAKSKARFARILSQNCIMDFLFYPLYSVDCQDMVSIISGWVWNGLWEFCKSVCERLFLFPNLFIFCPTFQRDEAKCPSLPHSCTCTQDSIGPQGPPGPLVKTLPLSSPLVYLHLLYLCLFSPD